MATNNVNQRAQQAPAEETLNKSEAFFLKYKNAIIGAVVALIVIVAGFILYNNYVAGPQAEKANTALAKGQEYFAQERFDLALNGDSLGFEGFAKIAADYSGDAANLASQPFVGDNTGSILTNVLKVAIMTPFFLFGFDVIPQAAEEINVPLKKIGKVLILSIVLAVGFYAMVVLAIGYAMSPEEITGSMKASGLVAADAMGKMFNSMVMAKIAIIGGMCGILTSWNSFLLGASRAIFSLGRIYMIPPFFGRIHVKYQTPANALWFVGILSALSVLCGRVMLTWVSDVASLACCFAYFMVSISFVVLRFNDKILERPYRVQRARIVGIVAIIMTGIMVLLFLIPGSGATLLPQEFAFAGGWLILGLVLGLYSQKKYRKERVKVDNLPIAKDRVQFYTPPRTK